MGNDLFNNLDANNGKKKEVKLVADKTASSKIQMQFNKLISKVSSLENKLAEAEKKGETLLLFFNKEFRPLEEKLAGIQSVFAFSLNERSRDIKFSKKTNEQIGMIICYLLKEVFIIREPTEDEEKLYDLWAPKNYKEQIDDMNDMGKSFIASMLKGKFGMDVDLKGVNLTDEHSFATFQAQFEEKMQEKIEAEKSLPDKSKKKTAKQLEKEAKEKHEEDLKNKSLRSIYISLSKILHPDLEQDLILKQEKEETMKLVTSAYNSNDLAQLLRLEMEWIHKTFENIKKISEEKLKIYCGILKERVSELQNDIGVLAFNPRFEAVGGLMVYSEKSALNIIGEDVADIKEVIENEENNLHSFNNLADKKHLAKYIDGMCTYILLSEMEEENHELNDLFNKIIR